MGKEFYQLTLAHKVTNYPLIVHFFSLKMAERGEAKSAIFVFDAKLRFALFASLRSANFSAIQIDN
jgi:hypothetical protein